MVETVDLIIGVGNSGSSSSSSSREQEEQSPKQGSKKKEKLMTAGAECSSRSRDASNCISKNVDLSSSIFVDMKRNFQKKYPEEKKEVAVTALDDLQHSKRQEV